MHKIQNGSYGRNNKQFNNGPIYVQYQYVNILLIKIMKTRLGKQNDNFKDIDIINIFLENSNLILLIGLEAT